MSAPQPTPGQWCVGDAGCTVFGPPNGNPSPEIIATIATRPFPSPKQRANAALIASAPALAAEVAQLRAALASK